MHVFWFTKKKTVCGFTEGGGVESSHPANNLSGP